MKNKLFRAFVVALAVSSLTISSVYAAPDADAIKDKKEAAEAEVSSLQEEIASVMREIDDLEEQLITTGEEINQATEDLAVAEEKEKDMIIKHMWPVTLALPRYKETFLMIFIDKYFAVEERKINIK